MPPTPEAAQSQTVVLAVVLVVGTIAIGGLAGIIFLIHSGTDATSLLAVSGPTTTALGILGAILVNAKSNPPQPIQQAVAHGYQLAVADVEAFKPAPAAPPPADETAQDATVPPADS